MSHQMSLKEAAPAERARSVAPPMEMNDNPARQNLDKRTSAAWNHLTTRLSRRPVNRHCHERSCAFTRKLEIRGGQDSNGSNVSQSRAFTADPAAPGRDSLQQFRSSTTTVSMGIKRQQIRKRACAAPERRGAARRAAGGLTFHSHRGSVRRHHWGRRQSSKAVSPSLAGCLLITLLRASRSAQQLLLLIAPPRSILGSVVSAPPGISQWRVSVVLHSKAAHFSEICLSLSLSQSVSVTSRLIHAVIRYELRTLVSLSVWNLMPKMKILQPPETSLVQHGSTSVPGLVTC